MLIKSIYRYKYKSDLTFSYCKQVICSLIAIGPKCISLTSLMINTCWLFLAINMYMILYDWTNVGINFPASSNRSDLLVVVVVVVLSRDYCMLQYFNTCLFNWIYVWFDVDGGNNHGTLPIINTHYSFELLWNFVVVVIIANGWKIVYF